jgi:hypothetical protein
VSFTVLPTVSVTFLVVSLTVSETLVPEDEESLLALAEADGVGVGLALDVELSLPPVKMPVIASPMPSSRPPPLLADAEGLGVAVSLLDVSLLELSEADGVGVALSSEPESDEPALPESEESLDVPTEDEGDGVALSAVSPLAEADGDGEAEEPSCAVTQSLYSSAVRLFDDGDVEPPLSASASEDVNPIPMRTAVGIATVAIALPAGMWNLVNSGFLGAA